MDDPEAGKTMLQTAKSGWYLRVLKEGMIKAGDTIKVVPGPRKLSIKHQNDALLKKRAWWSKKLLEEKIIPIEGWKGTQNTQKHRTHKHHRRGGDDGNWSQNNAHLQESFCIVKPGVFENCFVA